MTPTPQYRPGRRELLGTLVSAAALGGAADAPVLTAPVLTAPVLDANRVFQRDAAAGNPAGFGTAYNKGYGAVPLAVASSTPVSTAEMQIRLRDSARPETVVQDWIPWPGPRASSAAAVAILPASAVFYAVDIRLAADPDRFVTVPSPIGVGSVTVMAGQSVAVAFLTNYPGVSGSVAALAPGLTSSSVVYAPNTTYPNVTGPLANVWQTPTDSSSYQSPGTAEFLRLTSARLGVVAAMVGAAFNGAGIEQFYPFWVNGLYSRLKAVLDHAGWKFETFIWVQGSTDAGSNMRGAHYQRRLQDIFDAVTAETVAANGPAAIPYNKLLSPIPGAFNLGATPAQVNTIRRACKTMAEADPSGRSLYVPGLDMGSTSDGAHPTFAGRLPLARDFYRASMEMLGPARGGFARRPGPALAGVAMRAPGSTTIRLPVVQHGGTALLGVFGVQAPSPRAATSREMGTQFQVFAHGDVAGPLALDATAPVTLHSPTEIWLSLAAPPARNVALDVWYRLGADPAMATNQVSIRDDATGGDGVAYGRQLQAHLDPITVAADAPDAASVMVATMGGQAVGAGVTVAAGAAVVVAGAFTGPPAAGLEYGLNGGAFRDAGEAHAGGRFSFTFAAPAAGSHSLVVRTRPGAAPGATGGTSAAARFTSQPVAASLPVAGAIALYDASQPGTMWQDAAKAVAAADMQPVRRLADALGAASNDLLGAADPLLVPYLSVGEQNGLPGLVCQYRSAGYGTGRTLRSPGGAQAATMLRGGDLSFLLVFRAGPRPGNSSGAMVSAQPGATPARFRPG